jgi:hypothetical protein
MASCRISWNLDGISVILFNNDSGGIIIRSVRQGLMILMRRSYLYYKKSTLVLRGYM